MVVQCSVGSQQVGSGFETVGFSVWPFCVKSTSSLCVFSGCSGCLPQTKNTQVRLICNSKLPVGVNVSMSVSMCQTGDLSRVYPASPNVTPRDPLKDKQVQLMDGIAKGV